MSDLTAGEQAEVAADQACRDAVDEQARFERAKAKTTMTEAILASSREETPEQANVREVVEATAAPVTRAQSDIVPAWGGIRTTPAHMADWRYNALPEWERKIRTPDMDRAVFLHLKGMFLAKRGQDEGGDGGALLAHVMKLNKEWQRDVREYTFGGQRAMTLLQGDSAGGAPFDGTGGQAIPTPTANMVMAAFYRSARVRQLALTFTSDANSLKIPRQTAISVSGPVAEGATKTKVTPETTTNVFLQTQKAMSIFDVSNEMLEDQMAFPLVSWLLNDVAGEMGEREDLEFWQTGAGAGSNQPAAMELADVISNLDTAPGYIIPTLTQAANFFLTTLIDYDHMVKMVNSLPERERRNAVWMGNDQVATALSLIKDDGGRPMFNNQDAPGALVGDAASNATISNPLGYRFWNLPGKEEALGSVTDANSNRLYFGDPRRMYAILSAGGVQTSVSTDVRHETDETQYRVTLRRDGQPLGNPISGRFHYVFTGGIDGAGTPV